MPLIATLQQATQPTMLQLYSSTLHTEQLLAEVHHRCQNPPAAPQPPVSTPVQKAQSTPHLAVRAWRAFKESGYSWRWVARQIPGVLPAYLLVHTVLNLRQTLAALEQNQLGTQSALKLQQRQWEKQLQQLRYQQEKLQREHAQLRKRLMLAEKHLQQGLIAPQASDTTASEPLAQWYSAFEESQRGDVSQIAQRQAQYIPLVTPVLQALPQAPALDLGCGRGEWVQLLNRLGHHSVGVDSNTAMLQPAEAADADVHCQDIFSFLSEQPPERYALVTSFQVVEHLPPEQLLQLLQDAWRILRPGGMIILETPNPENIQVAAYSFWMDPTHQRPLPPPLLLNMAQHAGFVDCHIHRSSPWPPDQQTQGLPQPLARLLYADQDYALIARKPQAAPDAPQPAP